MLPHHIRSQGQILCDQVKEGERHGEDAHEEVRDGKVGDEDVSGCQEHLQRVK